MTARTAWTAGSGVGYTWSTAVSSGDLATMANGSTVMGSTNASGDITNQTAQDQYMDISFATVISSASTPAAGANFAFWIYALNEDGTHYGDNQLGTAGGSQQAITPAFPPCAAIGIPAVAVVGGTYYGIATAITIPPGTFRIACQNNSGFTLAGSNLVKYRTYNVNLNN